MPRFKRTKEQCCHQASPERDLLGLEDRPLVLGKPNTELGNGIQAAGPQEVPSLGIRSVSGTLSWHLQQAQSKEGGTGWAGFALQHFRDKAILLKKELGALQSDKHRGRASSASILLQSLVTRRRRRRKMAIDTLLCTGSSGPATSEPEGLSQPTEGWGEANRGLVAGLAKEQQDTGGESLPLFSPSCSCCPVTLACSSGHEPTPAGCLCLTHVLGHHTRQGPPAPGVLLWVTALSKTQLWLHG